jgi:ABC-type bacteriocin/lantibiotic exporter with double-glycine peptidase domain
MPGRIAIVLLLFLGLAAPGAWTRADDAAQAARPPGVWVDVPFVRQRQPNACGAASLSMLMRYWEKRLHEPPSPRGSQKFIDRRLDPHDRGILNTAMAGYLRASGYRVFTFSGRWRDLRENLAKGRPLVVGLGPAGKRGPRHYVVVAGIDWQRNFVFVNDPAERKLFRMTRRQFQAEWRVTHNWTLLAVPKEPA